MKILSWNCRGLGNPRAVRALKELVRSKQPDIIFLSETLVHKARLEEVQRMLRFDGCFVIDRLGRGGGIAMLWKDADKVTLNMFSQNFIDVIVHGGRNQDWRLMGFYGFPERSRRNESWNLLHLIAGLSDLPWVCVGDFNDLMSANEKEGGADRPESLYEGFRLAVEDCGLHDLPQIGGIFTWERWEGDRLILRERLDRSMENERWFNIFTQSQMEVLVSDYSDHAPILIDTEISFLQWRRKRFRFENSWLREPGILNVIQSSWGPVDVGAVEEKLTDCRESLINWSRSIQGDARQQIKALEAQLLRYRYEIGSSLAADSEYLRVKQRLQFLLEQEDVKWRQR